MPRPPGPQILVPVGSHVPWRALDYAHREAGPRGRVHLVHVTSWTEYDPFAPWGTVDGESREAYAYRDFRRRLDEADIFDVIPHVRFGSVAKEVARLAAELGARLIVLEWDGPGHLGPALVHPVAEGIVRIAPCPVLVLREQRPQRERAQERQEAYEPAYHPGHRGTW